MSNDPVKVKDLAAARGIDNLLYSADTYFRCARGLFPFGWRVSLLVLVIMGRGSPQY